MKNKTAGLEKLRLDPNSDQALCLQLKNSILELITNGVYKKGDKIPSERDLCEKYGVSRATTRGAMLALAQEGYIVRRSGSGSFVNEGSGADQRHAGRSGNIGFVRCQHGVYPHQMKQDYIYSDILEGIHRELSTTDSHLLFSYVLESDDELPESFVALMRKIDGLILGEVRNERFYEKVRKFGVPLVLINPNIDYFDSDSVDTDNVYGAFRAVEYLIALGHRQIAFINGRTQTRHAAERLLGYRNALEKHDIPFSSDLVSGGTSWQMETGYSAMSALLEKNRAISAVFAASDALAVGAISAVKQAGRRVPEDISVMGFDDMIIASHCQPPLSTVRVDRQEMGRAAVRRIVQIIRNTNTVKVKSIFTPELVIRDSCAKLFVGTT
jgi:LacI family transcriptional regulator